MLSLVYTYFRTYFLSIEKQIIYVYILPCQLKLCYQSASYFFFSVLWKSFMPIYMAASFFKTYM